MWSILPNNGSVFHLEGGINLSVSENKKVNSNRCYDNKFIVADWQDIIDEISIY